MDCKILVIFILCFAVVTPSFTGKILKILVKVFKHAAPATVSVTNVVTSSLTCSQLDPGIARLKRDAEVELKKYDRMLKGHQNLINIYETNNKQDIELQKKIKSINYLVEDIVGNIEVILDETRNFYGFENKIFDILENQELLLQTFSVLQGSPLEIGAFFGTSVLGLIFNIHTIAVSMYGSDPIKAWIKEGLGKYGKQLGDKVRGKWRLFKEKIAKYKREKQGTDQSKVSKDQFKESAPKPAKTKERFAKAKTGFKKNWNRVKQPLKKGLSKGLRALSIGMDLYGIVDKAVKCAELKKELRKHLNSIKDAQKEVTETQHQVTRYNKHLKDTYKLRINTLRNNDFLNFIENVRKVFKQAIYTPSSKEPVAYDGMKSILLDMSTDINHAESNERKLGNMIYYLKIYKADVACLKEQVNTLTWMKNLCMKGDVLHNVYISKWPNKDLCPDTSRWNETMVTANVQLAMIGNNRRKDCILNNKNKRTIACNYWSNGISLRSIASKMKITVGQANEFTSKPICKVTKVSLTSRIKRTICDEKKEYGDTLQTVLEAYATKYSRKDLTDAYQNC